MSDRNRGHSPIRRDDERKKRDIPRRERSRSRSPHRHSRSGESRTESKRNTEADGIEQRSQERQQRSHEKSESGIHRSHHRRSQEQKASEQVFCDSSPHLTSSKHEAPSADGATEGGINDRETATKPSQNFALSGKLTAETNTYRGVVIMYSEPPEAKIPKTRWRLYPFKENESLSTLYIHRQSAYLVGRDRRVVDIPIDHPSCSKQHAALQYRLVQYEKEDGSVGRRVRPYIIDLNSTNGTYVNNQRIESARYVELKEKDVLKFGFSSREYVMLHENSKDEEQADSGSESVLPPNASATDE